MWCHLLRGHRRPHRFHCCLSHRCRRCPTAMSQLPNSSGGVPAAAIATSATAIAAAHCAECAQAIADPGFSRGDLWGYIGSKSSSGKPSPLISLPQISTIGRPSSSIHKRIIFQIYEANVLNWRACEQVSLSLRRHIKPIRDRSSKGGDYTKT